MRKKFISILLSMAMVLSMLLAPGTEAMAAGDSGETVITNITAQTKTIKNLKKGKQYQVKVRAYKKVGKITYYGSWSTTKVSKKVK